jgi:excisionase family DNA binding protein
VERLLTADELAEYLKRPKATIYAWSHRGEGPRGIKCGRELRYRESDVERWLASRAEVGSGTEIA